MSASNYIVVYVTFASEGEAQRIARAIVEERLAACANVRSSGTSLYRWDGALEEAAEWVVLFKTRRSCFERLERRVVALHSYDTPCVISWDISQGHADYLAWIDEMTSGSSSVRSDKGSQV